MEELSDKLEDDSDLIDGSSESELPDRIDNCAVSERILFEMEYKDDDIGF